MFSSIRVFSNPSALRIRWLKYWSFSISPSNEYSGLISLGLIGLISLLSKGLSKSLHQQHNLKASVLWCSAFFNGPAVTSTQDYWKTVALTIWASVGKVTSLLFNTLSRLVTLMAKSEEELKNFLMGVKSVSEKAGLKLNTQKTKIRASSPITSWQ